MRPVLLNKVTLIPGGCLNRMISDLIAAAWPGRPKLLASFATIENGDRLRLPYRTLQENRTKPPSPGLRPSSISHLKTEEPTEFGVIEKSAATLDC